MYGPELILDVHRCNPAKFNRKDIEEYFTILCDLIDMTRCDLVFWDDTGLPLDQRQTKPHTKGISAVQFILTSSIVIHTLDILCKVFVNVFSCKDFDAQKVRKFTEEYFEGKVVNTNFIRRI